MSWGVDGRKRGATICLDRLRLACDVNVYDFFAGVTPPPELDDIYHMSDSRQSVGCISVWPSVRLVLAW